MFVTRTIRKGRVKIGKQWYAPSNQHMQYDGRLDGLRYIFGRYYRWGSLDNSFEPFVFLWGSQAAYKGKEKWGTGPEIVNGYLVWCWWRQEVSNAEHL